MRRRGFVHNLWLPFLESPLMKNFSCFLPGYQAAFSQLVFAGKKQHDSCPGVGDAKLNLANSLHQLSKAHPGTVSVSNAQCVAACGSRPSRKRQQLVQDVPSTRQLLKFSSVFAAGTDDQRGIAAKSSRLPSTVLDSCRSHSGVRNPVRLAWKLGKTLEILLQFIDPRVRPAANSCHYFSRLFVVLMIMA